MYKVIVVEDDPMVAGIDKKYVERNSELEVVEMFNDGAAALEYVSENPVDLVILDYYMPVMNGMEFLQALRSMGGSQDIIMATAANDAQNVRQLLSMGVIDYLIKPFGYIRFQAALSRFIDRWDALKSQREFAQEDLDKILSNDDREKYLHYMDKGIQPITLNVVCNFLRGHRNENFTIEELTTKVDLSKVTLRRYLNYLVDQDAVICGIDYATGGRPCSVYTYIGE